MAFFTYQYKVFSTYMQNMVAVRRTSWFILRTSTDEPVLTLHRVFVLVLVATDIPTVQGNIFPTGIIYDYIMRISWPSSTKHFHMHKYIIYIIIYACKTNDFTMDISAKTAQKQCLGQATNCNRQPMATSCCWVAIKYCHDDPASQVWWPEWGPCSHSPTE